MKSIRLAGGVAAMGLLLGLSSPAAADEVNWNFSTWGKPRAFTVGIEALRDYLDEKTGGKFKVKIHYGGAISPPKENLDGIKIGSHQAANFCTSYHPGKNPVGTVLDLAFLPFPNLNVQAKVHEDFYQHEAWVKEMKRWNAVPIFSGILPQYEFMGVGEAPKDASDFKGMRVRALGGIGDAMRKLGAVPTTMPAPETYTALERGIAQAISFPYSYTFGAYRLHEVGKWFTEGMQLGAVHCPIVMNAQAFNALPSEYQALFNEDLRWNSYNALIQGYKDADKKWIPIYHKNMKVVKFSKAQHDELKKIGAEPVWNEWVERNADKIPAQELLDFILDRSAHHSKMM